MSVRVSNWVWQRSAQSGSSLVVMLALADHAHDDGGGAYPSVKSLAEKARMSERQVRRILHQVRDDGEIEIALREGLGKVNVYRFTFWSKRDEEVEGQDPPQLPSETVMGDRIPDDTDNESGESSAESDGMPTPDNMSASTDGVEPTMGTRATDDGDIFDASRGHSYGRDVRTQLCPINRQEPSSEPSGEPSVGAEAISSASASDSPEGWDSSTEPVPDGGPQEAEEKSGLGAEPPAPRSKFEPPDYWAPLLELEDYVRRDHTKFAEVLEKTCEAQEVDPAQIVANFAKYYAGNKYRHGWSDPVATLRKTLRIEISKVKNERSPPRSPHQRRIAAEKKVPIREIRRT